MHLVSDREYVRFCLTLALLYILHCYVILRDGLTLDYVGTNLSILMTFILIGKLLGRFR